MSDRILIAEDNKNLCRILESALSEAGYEVAVALGGDAAVHEIKSHPFDLVISDMRMPGASGSVVFQEARAQEYQPDVILMTAFGDTRWAWPSAWPEPTRTCSSWERAARGRRCSPRRSTRRASAPKRPSCR